MILREIIDNILIGIVKKNNYPFRRMPGGYFQPRIFSNEIINITSCIIKQPPKNHVLTAFSDQYITN